jgi:octaprenyl-diphosphate synthase
VPTESIAALIGDDMRAIDALIGARLESAVPLVGRVSRYIIEAGGKRLRPALLVLSARACGGGGQAVHDIATVVEFIHTATLLHDDVVDGSSLRRGHPTANAAFGNAASVLVGDFVYSRAFQMMVAVGRLDVLAVLAEATNVIAEGEVLQLMNCRDPGVTEDRYLEVIRRKTAKLFEASARLGAMLAGAPMPYQQALAGYGMHLGTAFQLVDDALDYAGDLDRIGKNLGDDLAEGKVTLPLIHVLQRGSPDQAALVRNAVVEGDRSRFECIVGALNETGALHYARGCALAEAGRAKAALRELPDSEYRESLLHLAAFAVERAG